LLGITNLSTGNGRVADSSECPVTGREDIISRCNSATRDNPSCSRRIRLYAPSCEGKARRAPNPIENVGDTATIDLAPRDKLKNHEYVEGSHAAMRPETNCRCRGANNERSVR